MKQKRRPRGVVAMGLSCFQCAWTGRREHLPTSEEYPDSVMRRIAFRAGGGPPWMISALSTPRASPPPWKIVVITGAPSWAEYWAPTLAALPTDREMVVIDRPGYAHSEPEDCVPSIRTQAAALAPLLSRAPGQKLLLVGQSYGAGIATLMARANPEAVDGLVLLSGYFGESGPTARFLMDLGARVLTLIPRDLRHAVMEVTGQRPQLHRVRAALAELVLPVTFIHGDRDDFAPLDIAHALADSARGPVRFIETAGGNHFLNDGPVDQLLSALEDAIAGRGAVRRPAQGSAPALETSAGLALATG